MNVREAGFGSKYCDSCNGTCSGGCSGGCTKGCKGSCGTACSNSCQVGCNKGCGGQCTIACSGECSRQCSGCGGTCKNGCTSCTGGCSSCTSSCTGGCKETCTNGCKETCKTGCGNQCTGKDMASIGNLTLDKFMNASNISEILTAINYEVTRRAAKDSLKEISFSSGDHIDDEKINLLISNFNLLGHKLENQSEGKKSLETIAQEIVDKIKIAWKENYNNDNL